MVSEHQQTVELQRSVRYGRLLIGGAIIGGAIGSLVTLFFPVAEGALYTLGQIAGFMLLVGAIIGLALAGVLSLILTAVAKRTHGTGVVEQVVDPEPVGESEPSESEPTETQQTAE